MLRTIWFCVLVIGGVSRNGGLDGQPIQVEASCGSVSCFVVIGSQQQVPMKGLLTMNAIYNFTPDGGASGRRWTYPLCQSG
jgi:hypothetical protein